MRIDENQVTRTDRLAKAMRRVPGHVLLSIRQMCWLYSDELDRLATDLGGWDRLGERLGEVFRASGGVGKAAPIEGETAMSRGGRWEVNPTGIQEIACFLGSKHRRGVRHFTADMLRAWAADAEFQMDEGNPPMIEIRSWDSRSGHTETYIISDAGVSFEPLP